MMIILMMVMERILIVQTKLSEDVIEELKRKTGERTIKDALAKAVYHYLSCPNVESISKDANSERKVRSGRFPLYLGQLIKKYKMSEESISNNVG